MTAKIQAGGAESTATTAIRSAAARLMSGGVVAPHALIAEAVSGAIDVFARDKRCPIPRSLAALSNVLLELANEADCGRREWFTATELKRLHLPEMPRCSGRITALMESRSVLVREQEGHLWRRRRGAVGLIEFHINALPNAARDYLAGKPQIGWFTIRGLWRLNLDGLPASESRLGKLMKRWVSLAPDGLTRTMYRHGGGRSNLAYHAKLLPEAAQADLIRRGLWDGSPPGGAA